MNIRNRWDERKRELRKRGISLKWLLIFFMLLVIVYFLISKGVITAGF